MPRLRPHTKSRPTRRCEEYCAIVERAKEYVRAGDIFQVVPSQRFRRPFTLPSFALYRSLRRLNPSPFLYHLKFPGFAIVGSSPEILVRLRDGTVTIRPIAGTRKRGTTASEDAALADELMADPKERAEHLMLLDLGRNDVGRVAEIGTVKVTGSFFIERYSHVMHLVSNVEGKLRDGFDAIDALAAGLPAGTLSGAPKIRAMEIIDELEKEKRGAVYAGAVGYFAANGAMDTCIVLRTAVVKDGMMYVQAGGGVVADSVPLAEYEESVNKAKALMTAAAEAERDRRRNPARLADQLRHERDRGARKRFRHRAFLLGLFRQRLELGGVVTRDLRFRLQLDLGDGHALTHTVDMDFGVGVDALGRHLLAAKAGGQRHGVAAGMGRADQFLGIGAFAVAEAGVEGIGTFERFAAEPHKTRTVLQTATPFRIRCPDRHRRLLLHSACCALNAGGGRSAKAADCESFITTSADGSGVIAGLQ